MKLSNLLAFICAVVAFTFASCDDDKSIRPDVVLPPNPTLDVSIISRTGTFEVIQQKTITLVGVLSNLDLSSSYTWKVNGVSQSSTDTVLNFSQPNTGEYTVEFIATNEFGTSSATVVITVKGKYQTGVYILNEGSASTEMGSIIHIDADGDITPDAETVVNGNAFGVTAQNMFFANGKIYVVSKSTDAEHLRRLVVLNAETLKEVADYTNDLNTANVFSYQDNVGVIGDEIFLHAQSDVYSFHTVSKAITLIKNGNVSANYRMYTSKGKLFAVQGNTVKVFEAGKDTISMLMDFGAAVRSIARTDDGSILVAVNKTPAEIHKINPADYSVTVNALSGATTTIGTGSGMGGIQVIYPKGNDTIYFYSPSVSSPSIYQHVFSTNETTLIKNITSFMPFTMNYGGIAISPKTGYVYVSTISGYGMAYRINAITVIQFEKGNTPGANEIKTIKDYRDYTRFATGIYFPESYE